MFLLRFILKNIFIFTNWFVCPILAFLSVIEVVVAVVSFIVRFLEIQSKRLRIDAWLNLSILL